MNECSLGGVSVPPRFQAHEPCYLEGYRLGRRLRGGFRVNLDAMRYEPEEPLEGREFDAWTEGFRSGFIARRAAGEPT